MKRCKLIRKSGEKLRGCYRSCAVAKKSHFAKGSFRLIIRGKGARKVGILIACPKGKWRKGRCSVGTRAVRIDKPSKERRA